MDDRSKQLRKLIVEMMESEKEDILVQLYH